MANTSAARIRANTAYNQRKYDRKTIMMPKGMAEQLTKKAAAENKSLNRYILEAVEQKSGLKLTLDGEFKTGKK